MSGLERRVGLRRAASGLVGNQLHLASAARGDSVGKPLNTNIKEIFQILESFNYIALLFLCLYSPNVAQLHFKVQIDCPRQTQPQESDRHDRC